MMAWMDNDGVGDEGDSVNEDDDSDELWGGDDDSDDSDYDDLQ